MPIEPREQPDVSPCTILPTFIQIIAKILRGRHRDQLHAEPDRGGAQGGEADDEEGAPQVELQTFKFYCTDSKSVKPVKLGTLTTGSRSTGCSCPPHPPRGQNRLLWHLSQIQSRKMRKSKDRLLFNRDTNTPF